MDAIDKKILLLLQDNAKMPNSEIAKQVGMVPSGVLERIRKLEDNGYIKGYTTNLNPESLNLGLLAFVFLKTNEMPGCLETADKLAEFPEILEVHHVAGEDCYLLKIRLKNNQTMANFLREKIGNVPNVVSTKSVIVLETIKETSKINIPLEESEVSNG